MKIFKTITNAIGNIKEDFKAHPYINSFLMTCNVCLIVGAGLLINNAYAPIDMYDNSTAKVVQVDINGAIKSSVKVMHEVKYDRFSDDYEQHDEVTIAGSGSGTLIKGDNGEMFVITCEHVVDNTINSPYETKLLGSTTTITFMRKKLDCTIIFADKATDVALLKVNTTIKSFRAVELFADGYGVEAGDVCYAIGYPQGVGPCITQGIISTPTFSFHDWNGYDNNSILSDVTIDHGNSGGGLFVCKDGKFYFAGMSRWGGLIKGVYGFADIDTIRSTFDNYAVGYLLEAK